MSEDTNEARLSTPELIPADKKVEKFIDRGIELSREGKWEEAIKYLRDRQFAKSVGYFFRSSRDVMLKKTPTKKEYL